MRGSGGRLENRGARNGEKKAVGGGEGGGVRIGGGEVILLLSQMVIFVDHHLPAKISNTGRGSRLGKKEVRGVMTGRLGSSVEERETRGSATYDQKWLPIL